MSVRVEIHAETTRLPHDLLEQKLPRAIQTATDILASLKRLHAIARRFNDQPPVPDLRRHRLPDAATVQTDIVLPPAATFLRWVRIQGPLSDIVADPPKDPEAYFAVLDEPGPRTPRALAVYLERARTRRFIVFYVANLGRVQDRMKALRARDTDLFWLWPTYFG